MIKKNLKYIRYYLEFWGFRITKVRPSILRIEQRDFHIERWPFSFLIWFMLYGQTVYLYRSFGNPEMSWLKELILFFVILLFSYLGLIWNSGDITVSKSKLISRMVFVPGEKITKVNDIESLVFISSQYRSFFISGTIHKIGVITQNREYILLAFIDSEAHGKEALEAMNELLKLPVKYEVKC